MDDRKCPDARLAGGANETFAEFGRLDLAADCVRAGLDRSPIFLAVVGRPVSKESGCRITKVANDPAASTVCENQADGSKLRHPVPGHGSLSEAQYCSSPRHDLIEGHDDGIQIARLSNGEPAKDGSMREPLEMGLKP